MTIPPDRGPDKITPGQAPQSPDRPSVPLQGPSGFDQYMQGTAGGQAMPPGTNVPQAAGGPTPMDMVRGPQVSSAGVSFDSILAQSKTAQDSLGTVESQLNDKNLKLRRSQSHLVRQKLGDANSYIRAAGSKLGAEMPEGKTTPGLNGIARFIAMVNDGQDQLVQVQQQLQKLSAQGTQMSPGEMLSVQVKMGLAQQEIEYTSTLLSRVIQGITQIINTQL